MVADGIFNIRRISVKLPVPICRLYEHWLYLWDYYYVLEIGEYTQKKTSLHIISIAYYNPWLKPRLHYLHSRYFQGISATLFFMIAFATGSSVPSRYLCGIKTWKVYRQ